MKQSAQAAPVTEFMAPPLQADELSETFLLEVMKENLNQARHAENERMMFVTLFAALVGGVLSVVADMENTFFASFIIVLLLVLNYVCYELTKRWNNVFKAHWSMAKRISCYLAERSADNGFSPAYEIFTETYLSQYPHLNRYFCFDNSRNYTGKRRYIRTSQLFSLFNICIFILLGMSLLYVHRAFLAGLFF